MAARRESDLYEPVSSFLRSRGYEVRGEVKGVDVVAIRGQELVAIELKTRLTLDLVVQAVDRQRSTGSVYIAVPARSEGPALRNYRRVTAMLKRLELGLILVHHRPSGTRVEVRFHPAPYRPRRSKRNRRAIIREFTGRTGDRNTGGSPPSKLVTAYRESAVFIACALDELGTASPADLRAIGTGKKTQSILSKNFYGWFDRVDRGRYTLHEAGKEALASYPDLVDHYSSIVSDHGGNEMERE